MRTSLPTVHIYVPPQYQPLVPGYGDVQVGAGREIIFLADDVECRARLGEIEYLLTIAPPKGAWGQAGCLRLLQAIGAGIDHLFPLDELPASCVVANSAGINSDAVAEAGLALALFLRKGYPALLTAQRARDWVTAVPPAVRGSRMVILGCGRIGMRLAGMARPLGIHVSGTWSRPSVTLDGVELHPPEAAGELITQADILVSLLPATERTRGFLDAAMLSLLNPDAVFVNLGRGGVVDEGALIAMLRDGRLAGAAMDVFAQEPLPRDSPLWHCPNLIVSPHCAGAQSNHLAQSIDLFLRNVAAIERGDAAFTEVDTARGY